MQETRHRGVRAHLTQDDRQLDIVLDNGKGNIVDLDTIRALREILARHGSAAPLCAVRIDHTGKHFSFGASVPEHRPGQVETMLTELHGLARALVSLDVPILASVRGMCLGGGLELAALADRVFASPDARFGQPEIALGVFAPIGSALLPHLVGPRRAADLLLSGRTVASPEALDMGLVGEIADDPSAAANAWSAQHLLPRSASSLRFATNAARWTWRDVFLSDLRSLEHRYVTRLMKTRDAVEGIEAFLEKRSPRWEDS